MRNSPFFALLLLTGCMETATQKTAGPTVPEIMGQLRKEYDTCVYTAAGKQFQANPNQDANYVSEIAFQACTTEEQAILALLYSTGMAPATVSTAMVSVKLQLKRTMRDIAANPAKYQQKPPA